MRCFITIIFVANQAISITLNAQTITIDLAIENQTISGFGGVNMPGWIDDLTEDQTDKAFGNDPGQIGLSILRIRIPNDTTYFYKEVKTAVRAKSHGAIVIGSPWSPPVSMKSNKSTTGGYLLPESYGAYADHLVGFAYYMKKNGAPLYAISLQNEPDITVDYESCDWTPEQMINFLKEQGSKFDSAKVIAAESYNFDHAKTDPILNDPDAEQYVNIIGGHIYGGGLADYPLAREKGKEVWMTEHLTGNSSPEANTWSLALDLATEINDCMKANFNAYIWWYLRRFYSMIDEDGNITKKGYVMSQFSKFIRPGSIRIGGTVNSAPGIDVTAYKTDSNFVVIVINQNDTSVNLDFTIQNGSTDTLTKFTTSTTENVVNDGEISISGDTFNATVDGKSITTFASYSGDAGKYGNVKPIANAGSDVELYDNDSNGFELIMLDGSGSSDPDGIITNYSWSLNGKQIAWTPTAEVEIGVGKHTTVLTVTDNDGARHYDTVSIIINSLNKTHIWLEAECGQVGSNWNLHKDDLASNGEYVMVSNGIQSLDTASTDTSDHLVFAFKIDEPGTYMLWGRAYTPTYDDDSFWAKMDTGAWARWNGIRSTGSGWHWDDVHDDLSNNSEAIRYILDIGTHTFTICYREDGAGLDKLYLTNTGATPSEMGDTADNCPEDSIPDNMAIIKNNIATISVFPNPLESNLVIKSDHSFISLEIYNMTGRPIIQKKYNTPINITNLNLTNYKSGIYLLILHDKTRTLGVKRFNINQ